MLPALRPRIRLPLGVLRRLLSSHAADGGDPSAAPTPSPADSAAMAAAKAQEAMAARREAYRKVQNFDWSSGADWKTAANILFTVPPKRKEFGLDFHLVQLFFVCMPSLAVYLVAMYARREIKRMEAVIECNHLSCLHSFFEFCATTCFMCDLADRALGRDQLACMKQFVAQKEAEAKRKKAEELEKQKQLEADSVKEDADSKLATVFTRLDTLEGVVKEIAGDKRKGSALDESTKQDDDLNKGEASSSDSNSNASDSRQLATAKSKDTTGSSNAP